MSKKCLTCGREEIFSDTKYCSNCGDIEFKDKNEYCKYCHAIAGIDDNFCYKCGKNLKEVIEPELTRDGIMNCHKSWNILDWIEHWWHIYFWNYVSMIPSRIKWFIQRGVRGWADNDLWEMHAYLSEVILNMLVKLKQIKHGVPSTLDPTSNNYDYDEKRWDEILDKMINGFKYMVLCEKESVHRRNNMTDEQVDKMTEGMHKDGYPDFKFLTKEEEVEIVEAWVLFAKYFESLWD